IPILYPHIASSPPQHRPEPPLRRTGAVIELPASAGEAGRHREPLLVGFQLVADGRRSLVQAVVDAGGVVQLAQRPVEEAGEVEPLAAREGAEAAAHEQGSLAGCRRDVLPLPLMDRRACGPRLQAGAQLEEALEA